MAECPDGPVPGFLFGSTRHAEVQSSADGGDWRFECILRGSSAVGTVREWPVVALSDHRLRNRRELGPYDGLLYVSGEWMQAGRAELVGAKVYRLGELRRGLRGSREREHGRGEQVMVVDETVQVHPCRPLEVGQARYWRCTADGANRDAQPAMPYYPSGTSMPSIDGTRMSVDGIGALPAAAKWGERWATSEGVYTWLDQWIREPLEAGAVVFSKADRARYMWDGAEWEPLTT